MYITNDIAVDPATEIELLDNGQTADNRVAMARARGFDGQTYVYLRTNGDPVALQDDSEAISDFLADLGRSAQDAIDALENTERDDGIEWAIDTLRPYA